MTTVTEHMTSLKAETRVRGVDARRCYDAIATGDGMNQWFTTGAEYTDRPGSTMRLRWEKWGAFGEYTGTDEATVVDAVPGERFSFYWNYHLPQPTLVDFEFIPDGADTVIRVTGSGYGTDQKSQWTLVDCSIGWGEALTLVKFWLEHGVRY